MPRFFVALLSLLVMGTAGLGQGSSAALPASPDAETAGSRLPLEAQYAVSAVIGRDDSGYHALDTAAGVELENPAQGVRLVFGHEGATLQVDSFVWQMGLVSWGVGDARTAVATSAPVASGNRVEVDHGGVTEWYVNGPFGLQQGFTIAAPPAERDGAPLVLRLAAPEGWVARMDPDRRGLTWCRPNGAAVLHYTGLIAVDACGEPLPAWLETRGGLLFVCVDEAGAAYPVTVDPWIQTAKLTASDGAADDYFGNSVAIDGDTVVVGAYHDDIGANSDQGSAYVFVEPGGGWATTSTYDAKLTASDGAADDWFGVSVAIDGDTVVVGAPLDDIGANSNQGSAYVFVEPGGGWATTSTYDAKLTASDGAADDYFGWFVAISGDTVVVGAYGDDSAKGSAYVFEKGGGWTTTSTYDAKLTASDGVADDEFGNSVAIDGDTAVVGACGDDSAKGSAYVFEKGGGWTTTSTYDAKLTASDGEGFDYFGVSVAISGATVVVGAYNDEVGPNDDQGSAYVFEKGEAWATATETAKLTASDGAANDWFGSSVAIDGDTVVVGAQHDDVGANSRQGSAYVFEKGGAWASGSANQTAKLAASDGEGSDWFGNSVAIDGDTVVVGTYWDDIGANDFQGSAYVFSWAAITVVPTSGLVTTEAGGTATFDVSAGSEPAAAVVVPLQSSDPSEGTVPASVLLPAGSTDPVTVTVTGVDDDVDDGDRAYVIVTGDPTSANPSYNALDADDVDDVSVTNQNDDIGAGTLATFRVDSSGRVFADQTVHAGAFEVGAADVAEWVTVSESVEAGDVIEFDPTATAAYRPSQAPCSSLIAGVVSTAPGIVLGENTTSHQGALLALTGIVPVKVTDEGGPIQPGDLLVTSSTPGHAMRWAGSDPCPCALVGKALEPMTDETGVILVLLTAH